MAVFRRKLLRQSINLHFCPIQTRFRCGSGCFSLNRPLKLTRWLILQKARRQALKHLQAVAPIALRPFVSTRFQVLFHSLYQGSFHLSLTVLVRYRSSNVFSLGRWTSQLPTGLACPVVLRITTCRPTSFAYGTVTLSGFSFQLNSATRLSAFSVVSIYPNRLYLLVWAFPRSLATTEGILSFPEGTEMFQFPSFPLTAYLFNRQCRGLSPRRVSPFGYPRILRLHTAPRGFSQCTTSFIGI